MVPRFGAYDSPVRVQVKVYDTGRDHCMPPNAGGFIDLHSHSLASDGQYPAAVVATKAASAGVDVWSLTDHDSIAALEPGRAAAEKLRIRFVPGIELSVHLERREVHLLGHFVDPDSEA